MKNIKRKKKKNEKKKSLFKTKSKHILLMSMISWLYTCWHESKR